jgi:hypothetical protein
MPLDQDAYLKFLKDWHASPLLLYNLGTIHLSIMPKYLANDEAIAKFSERNDWFQKIFTEAAPGQPAYFGARSQLRDWSVISSATKYAVHGITSTMVRRHGNLVRFAPLKCNQLMSALQQNAVIPSLALFLASYLLCGF